MRVSSGSTQMEPRLTRSQVSMIDGTLFDKLEHVARIARRRSEPFGGLQVWILICVRQVLNLCLRQARALWRFLSAPPRPGAVRWPQSARIVCFRSRFLEAVRSPNTDADTRVQTKGTGLGHFLLDWSSLLNRSHRIHRYPQ